MQADVVFTIIFKKDGDYLASPTILGEYGREVCVEIPGAMRAVVLARAPDRDGRSFTSAKMAIYQDGAWQPEQEMTMEAYLSLTPSFQYSVPDTAYRFGVMPRRIVPPAADGKYLAVGKTSTTRNWHFE